jgi:mRNA interferase RelE/StbE
MYALRLTKAAIKGLRAMPATDRARMKARLSAIARNPQAPQANIRALKGSDSYRVRVGEWRAVYDIEHNVMTVTVIEIGHRREIYR